MDGLRRVVQKDAADRLGFGHLLIGVLERHDPRRVRQEDLRLDEGLAKAAVEFPGDGAGEFQDLLVGGPSRGPGVNEPLYLRVARNVAEDWNENGNCALVVGATYPEEMKRVREVAGDIPLLIPGIGAQGGDIARTVAAGRDSRGTGFIIAVARSIIFASSGKDFAEAARQESEKIHGAIVDAL